MKVLGGEAERGEFCHCPPVIVVTALAVTEVKIANGGGVFNYTSFVLFESKFKRDTFLAAARSQNGSCINNAIHYCSAALLPTGKGFLGDKFYEIGVDISLLLW